LVAPQKKRLQFVVHDFVEGFDTYAEKPGYTWPAVLAFSEVDPSEYVVLVIPGGRAPEYIRNDPDFERIARHFFEEELPVAQLCHASQALGAAGLLRGRRTAAYPALVPDVQAAGGEFVDSEAVVDGQMVSARAWPDHSVWMREFVRLLREKAPVEPAAQAVGSQVAARRERRFRPVMHAARRRRGRRGRRPRG
jgi:protease I